MSLYLQQGLGRVERYEYVMRYGGRVWQTKAISNW